MAVRAGAGHLLTQGTGGTRELPSNALLLGTGRKANVQHLVQACRMPSTASPQVEPGMGPLRVTVEAIGPGRGPCQLSRDESRRMNFNDAIVYRCLRFLPFHQRHPDLHRSPARRHAVFDAN